MMTCREFEHALDRYLGGTLPDEGRAHCDAHLLECEECSAVVAALSVAPDGAPDFVPFLHAHRMAEHRLPEFAQLDPGPEFSEAVLLRTRRRAQLRRTRLRVQEWWFRQLERPQLASEAAYAFTVLLVLAVFVPSSPLAPALRDTLSWIQSEESSRSAENFVEARMVPVLAAPARWVESGGEMGATVGDELDSRADVMKIVLKMSGTHAKDLGETLWERDWESLRPLLTQLRCDLQLLWEATRGNMQGDDEDAFRC